MTCKFNFVVVVACMALYTAHSQPVVQPVVLKDAPEEVLFRVEKSPKPFSLNCIVDSGDSSQAKYEWLKDGKPLSNSKAHQSQGKLEFSEPADSDEGSYRCLVTSSAGVASTKAIRVKKTYINVPKVESKSVQPVVGRPFELDCKVPDGYPTPKIEWKRQPLSGGKAESALSPRIFSPQGSLYFSNATEDDVSKDFKYVCLATSPAADGEVLLAEHSVTGLAKDDKPADNEVVRQFVSSDMTAKVGDVTELYCVYGGNPMPHPDWWKDGKNVNNKGGDRVTRYNRSKGKRLLIKETLPEDDGQYTCVIDNEVGKVQNHTLRLTIVGVPKFSKKPEKRVQVKEGQELVLPCEVEKMLPNGEKVWTFNARPLSNEHASRVSVTDKGLVIKNVQKSDAGYYGCKATNKVGEAYAESAVQVV